MRHTILAAFTIVMATTLPAKATDLERIEQVMQAASTDNQFMGAVLAVKDGKVLLDKGYGYANLEWRIPNPPGTRFRAVALGKQFTAASVLLLAERGKL